MRRWSLATWSIWYILLLLLLLILILISPRIFIIFLCEYWDYFILRNTRFANRTYHCLPWLLKPLINTCPAIEMSTLCNYWFFGRFEANVAFKHASTVLLLITLVILLLRLIILRIIIWFFFHFLSDISPLVFIWMLSRIIWGSTATSRSYCHTRPDVWSCVLIWLLLESLDATHCIFGSITIWLWLW